MASLIGGVLTTGSTRYWDPGEGGQGSWIDPYDHLDDQGNLPPALLSPALPAIPEGPIMIPPPMNPWEEAPKPVPSPAGITPQPAVPIPVPPGILPPGATPEGSWTPPKIGPWQPPSIMPPKVEIPSLPDVTKPFDMAGDFMMMIVVMSLVRE